MNIRQILFSVFAVVSLVGCGGSQQGSSQSRVRMVTASEGAEQSQQSGDIAVDAAFPSECAGLQKVKEEPACYGIKDRRFCSQTAVLCSCDGNGTQVRWAMLKSPENLGQNGYCTGRPPVARQVERVSLAPNQTAALPPPALPAPPPPVAPVVTAPTPPAPVSTAILTPPAVEARELAQQTTCTNDLTNNALRCKVNRRQVAGGVTIATADEFVCVGHNFTPLSAQQLNGYTGQGAPCTCTQGQMKQMSGVKNTWWCDAGDAG